jgi:cAMP-dependent protein kinase regulator
MIFFRKEEKKSLKETADAFYTKGQWSSALTAYEKAIEGTTPDVKVVRRIGDLRAKLGLKAGAVDAYRKVADMYASTGFLVQAIAIYKILLRLDPSADDIGKKLVSLYAERGIGTTPAPGSDTGSENAPVVAAPPPELPKIPLFSDLPADAFGKLVDRLVSHELTQGQYLFREGAPGDSIFIVTSGSVQVVRQDRVLAELGEGEFFGEGAFFSREPRNADVRSGQDTELLEIRREDLQALMAQYPKVSEALNLFYRQRILDRMLASSPLTAELDPQVRSEIVDLFETVQVHPGDVLIREGNRDRIFYFVTRGRFSVATIPPGGVEPMTIGEIVAGQFFGEITVLTHEARTATVTAMEEGEVLRADGEDLDPFLHRYPSVRAALEKMREERAEATVAKILGRHL